MPSTERRVCSARHSRSIETQNAFRQLTTGARSRPSRKPSRPPAPPEKEKISAPSNTENETGRGDRKNRKPVWKNRSHQCGKIIPKTGISGTENPYYRASREIRTTIYIWGEIAQRLAMGRVPPAASRQRAGGAPHCGSLCSRGFSSSESDTSQEISRSSREGK